MKTARNTLAIMVAATGLFAAATASAADYHVDDVARRLEGQAREMTRELRSHFRHAPHYGHLMADAGNIARSARHIHDVAHNGGNLRHLSSDLRTIDAKVHHLADVINEIRRDVHHGVGHFDGNASHAYRLVRRMQATVHHLQRDIRLAMRTYDHHNGHHHTTYYRSRSRRSAGISWNGKNISIQLGSHF